LINQVVKLRQNIDLHGKIIKIVKINYGVIFVSKYNCLHHSSNIFVNKYNRSLKWMVVAGWCC